MITDNKTIEMLTAAGWYPGRCVDVSVCKKELLENNLELFPAAEQFLQEFSGITLSWQYQIDIGMDGPKIIDRTQVIKFNWIDFEYAPLEDIEYFKSQVGDDLCFVGKRESDWVYFAICRDGRFVGNNDGEMCLYGNNIEEGLINIVHWKSPIMCWNESDFED